MRSVNLIGQTFSRLTVLEKLKEKRGGRNFWLCRCSCGNYTEVSTANLRSGAVKSCGCLAKEIAKKAHTSHGQRGTRLYQIWIDMRRRCRDKNLQCYKNYGDRGISVCKEWDEDFMTFYEWAMSNGYNESLTIDRIDVNGNYEPSNCRWATHKEQANNTRLNRYVIIDGIKKTFTEWCGYYGNNSAMVRERIKRGWDEIKAIQTPQLMFFRKRMKHAKF